MTPEIRRVTHLTTKDIRECIRNSQPAIATEMLKSWKASETWTFDFFKQRYGTDMVQLADGRFQPLVELPLAACLDIIQTLDLGNTYEHYGATPYIQGWVLLDDHPELKEDVELPAWFRNWERPLWKLFRPRTPYYDTVALAGPAGATTYIHRDRHRTHAWLAQLVGRKKWTLFPPDQYALVHTKNFEVGGQPWVNIANPDLEQFPDYKRATPIEFVMHPGEFVFLPSGWLHQVTSLDATISLGGNFVDSSNIAVFVKDACREVLENLKEPRRLPPALERDCRKLAEQLEGTITYARGTATVSAPWEDCELKLTANRHGMSWTLENYHHGRNYTSFFADRRTDFNYLGLSPVGAEAARELLSLSPRHEFRLIAGMSTSNVVLYGTFADDLCVANRSVLGALQRLTESLVSPADMRIEAKAAVATDESLTSEQSR